MLLPILALGAVSFVISWLATWAMIRIAPKLGFVDRPGGRKIHANPKPLGGGVAMFIGFALPMLVGLTIVNFYHPDFTHWQGIEPYWSGGRNQTPLVIGLLLVMLVMHVMGLIDDRKAMGPYVKLIVQLAAVTGLILTMEWYAPPESRGAL